MRLRVNGKLVDREGATLPLLTVLEELDVIGGRGVAVAVNDEVRPRSAWPTSELHDGDEVIVLTATQGG